jgi:DNA-binding protein HU-beta
MKTKLKPMTKNQILNHISGETDLSKKDVQAVLDSQLKLAYDQSKAGFTIQGLGKLILVHRKKRKGRNPSTGQSIIIPAKNALKFRISKVAKDNVL